MDKKIEEIYKKSLESSKCISLEGMAVHCKTGDFGFQFVITVGRSPYMNQSGGSKNELNLPHAFVFIKDEHFISRFLLTNETIPRKPEDLKIVDETDMPLTKIAKDLIKWINLEPIRSFSKGNRTNWDAMISSWIDIQDVLNE